MQTSPFYTALTVTGECRPCKKKAEAGYRCDPLTALLERRLWCLCIGEPRFKLVSPDLHIRSAWTQRESLALAKTTYSHITPTLPPGWCAPFGQADGSALCRSCPACLCFSSDYSSWDEISERAKSGRASLWLTRTPSPPEKHKSCGNRSAEVLGETESVNGMVNPEAVTLCKSSLLLNAALLFWQRGQTPAGGSTGLAKRIRPPSAKLWEIKMRALDFCRLRRGSSKWWW